MNIAEQLECLSAADADPVRRCRIKCCAAGVGGLCLALVLLIGAINTAPDNAAHSVAQTGSAHHE